MSKQLINHINNNPKATLVTPQVQIVDSIRSVNSNDWNSCFPNELEDYFYLLAAEEAGIPRFKWRYIIAEEEGCIIAAIPAFLTNYQLDTTLEKGLLKSIVSYFRKYIPNFLTIKLACLGSPVTEHGYVGFAPSLQHTRRKEILSLLVSTFETYAIKNGYKLIGVKDIPSEDKSLWTEAISYYYAIPSLATAYLNIVFKNIDEYLGLLSKKTRKDMRRKLKAREQIQIEYRTNIDDVLPQVLELYAETRARSQFQFEELTAQYFQGVLKYMKNRSFCILYWYNNKLLAANLILMSKHKLLDKFFCMDNSQGRKLNLYFLSWFNNLEYCLENKLETYQSGQACYDNKIRLKSQLKQNWMLFKHTNALVNLVLKLISPLLIIGMEEK